MNQDIDLWFARFFPDEAIQPFAYRLSQHLREGHVCIRIPDQEELTPLGPLSNKALEKVSPAMIAGTDASVPFIVYDGSLYLQRYFRYETSIIDHLDLRLSSSLDKRAMYQKQISELKTLIAEEAAVNDLSGLASDEMVDWQLIAVLRVLQNDFSIITGGPGTGKTTTLAKLLRLLFALQPESRVALAAPTGKASMRMLDSLKERTKDYPGDFVRYIQQLKPFTLHRLLGYQPNSIYFKHNRKLPLNYDWVIVDEASMIDMPLFAKLLEACSTSTRLLLLGDKDQLASVEAGSLFGDLCLAAGNLNRYPVESIKWLNDFINDPKRKIPEEYAVGVNAGLSSYITELRHSRRFQQQGGIGKLSLSIIRGEVKEAIDLLQIDKSDTIRLINGNDERAFAEFVSGYYNFLEENDTIEALTKLNQLRVLVAVREGESGLFRINQKIERILHDQRPDLIRPDGSFYHNRPIIITKNNYELGLYNGDVGIVRREPGTRKLVAYFESEPDKPLRSFIPASLNDCETVFAMTIHKSQGSEFDRVLMVLPEQADNPLLTRELLYTGITRAKQYACIQGSEESLLAGISRQVLRISGIQTRMNK